MPADVVLPVHPPDVAHCPNVPLPHLAGVLRWQGPVPASVQAWGLTLLKYPLGTVVRDTVGGVPVVARIECHFGFGAHPEQPGYWHKGASVFHPAQYQADGSLAPLTTPPDGWPSSGTG